MNRPCTCSTPSFFTPNDVRVRVRVRVNVRVRVTVKDRIKARVRVRITERLCAKHGARVSDGIRAEVTWDPG